MRQKLKVDLSELANAMESTFEGMHHYYLDTATGEVILVQDEILSAVESDDQKRLEDCPEWQEDMVEEVRKIMADNEDRYRSIPALESWESFKHMEAFVDAIQNEDLQDKLAIALDGKGAFGRFKRVLENYPSEKDRWYKFKDERMKEEAEQFLISIDIEAIEAT